MKDGVLGGGECTTFAVFLAKIFVAEDRPIYAHPTSAIFRGDVTALAHELRDDPVEYRIFVVETDAVLVRALLA